MHDSAKFSELRQYFQQSAQVIFSLQDIEEQILELYEACKLTISQGGNIFWMGNGGSASDAQHLAAELVGRFRINRRPIGSIALNTDTSVITCVGNDFGFEHIFSRQIEALGKKEDLLIGISTSGKSRNIINALVVASKMNIKTALLTGKELSTVAEIVINVPSQITSHIQESHIAIGQLICGMLESDLVSNRL